MSAVKPEVLRGFRDLLPANMVVRERVIHTIRTTYQQFGFEPLETPALEYARVLEGKYGPEAERLIYKFRDMGRREVALRYDLTVPLARVVALYPDLSRHPFKRYQISPVWRHDNPQRGRYREFYQCDVDIVGSASVVADAEVVACVYTVLRRLGIPQFVIRINSRKILAALAACADAESQAQEMGRAIDKLERIGWDGVGRELAERGFGAEQIERITSIVQTTGAPGDVLQAIAPTIGAVAQGAEGIRELTELLGHLELFQVDPRFYRLDLSLARGLDIYTGPIFEIVVEEQGIGSITGGGRYDKLIGIFIGRDIPATGISIGLDRLLDIMGQLGLTPTNPAATQVIVTVFDETTKAESLKLTADLRAAGINTELFLGEGKLRGQLAYASGRGVPLVAILGPDELARGEVNLKEMRTGQQTSVGRRKAVEEVKRLLGNDG